MLSLGWSELAVIILILALVIGPKELPNLLKHIGSLSKKIKSVSREFNTSINNLVKEADIDSVKKNLKEVSSINIKEKILDETNTKSEFEEINSSFKKLDNNIKSIKKDTENIKTNERKPK